MGCHGPARMLGWTEDASACDVDAVADMQTKSAADRGARSTLAMLAMFAAMQHHF
jgi:hypothetical protein